MKRLPALIAAVGAVGAAGPAAAQNGASWAVGDSGVTTILLSGANQQPVRADRTPEEMASLFKAACLDSGGRPEAIDSAVAEGKLRLAGSTVTVNGSKKRPPVQVRLWSGPGVVVAWSDGFFAMREAQCNATFHPITLPTDESVAEALAKVLGGAPINAGEAVKKNGKPDKGFVPRWTWSEGSNAPVTVNGFAMRGNRYAPGDKVLMAARPVSEPAR